MEERSLKEVCDDVIARCNAYRLQHLDQAKAHRLQKRRTALKNILGKFLWFTVIIVLPLIFDFMYPKIIPLLCWLNLSAICGAR